MRHRIAAVLLLAASLAACSKPAPPAPPAKPQAATQQPAVSPSKGGEITKDNQGVLTDRQAKALNESNQVGNVLNDADEARKKQMKEQGI